MNKSSNEGNELPSKDKKMKDAKKILKTIDGKIARNEMQNLTLIHLWNKCN